MPTDSHQKPILDDPVWTIREVAEIFGVTVDTVKRWLKHKGFPPPMKIGGTCQGTRWRKSTIEKYLAQQAREAEVLAEAAGA